MRKAACITSLGAIVVLGVMFAAPAQADASKKSEAATTAARLVVDMFGQFLAPADGYTTHVTRCHPRGKRFRCRATATGGGQSCRMTVLVRPKGGDFAVHFPKLRCTPSPVLPLARSGFVKGSSEGLRYQSSAESHVVR